MKITRSQLRKLILKEISTLEEDYATTPENEPSGTLQRIAAPRGTSGESFLDGMPHRITARALAGTNFDLEQYSMNKENPAVVAAFARGVMKALDPSEGISLLASLEEVIERLHKETSVQLPEAVSPEEIAAIAKDVTEAAGQRLKMSEDDLANKITRIMIDLGIYARMRKSYRAQAGRDTKSSS